MLAQRSFEELGTSLADATFCVVDLETTGGSPADSAITEIGAVNVRRGAVEGTFQTLVDPGQPVPAVIRLLTGIDDTMLAEAPAIEAVLPSFLEFAKGAVLVAHNARFDIGFLNVALRKSFYPPLTNPVLDTALLARKILQGEVPNNKLETLARHLRCAHQPCHRAFADVLATVDVLHHLIERVAGFGVTTVEDLAALSGTKLDGTFSKIKLTEKLPRGIGIYRFIGPHGNTLYVGKATDVRSRVRSYFFGDPRRKMRDLLRETQEVNVELYPTLLEAEVAEARAIAAETPPYNRAGKRSGSWYLKVSPSAKSGRVAAAKAPKEDGSTYVGPFPSMKTVRSLIDCLRDAMTIHRCSEPARCRGCAFSELGTCSGPDPQAHKAKVGELDTRIKSDHGAILDLLFARMTKLARQERFEEAAELRERAALLERALARAVEVSALVAAGKVALAVGDRLLLISGGKLVSATDLHDGPRPNLWSEPEGPVPRFTSTRPHSGTRGRSSRGCAGTPVRRILHAQNGWHMPVGTRPGSRFSSRSERRAQSVGPSSDRTQIWQGSGRGS